MIIWGSKAKQNCVGSGSFFCPNCKTQAPYSHQRVSRYFTLYFIPLFPTSTLGSYVQCGKCGGQFVERVLNCSREEILKVTEPWICPKCGNRNPASQERCLGCGNIQDRPPLITEKEITSNGRSESNAPPLPSKNSLSRKPMRRGIKVLILTASVVLAGLIGLYVYHVVKLFRETRSNRTRSTLYLATSRIGPDGKLASGNSKLATVMAEEMSLSLAKVRNDFYSDPTEKSPVDQNDAFKVYCDLRISQCVFLVHVPELRRFTKEAQIAMGNQVWQEALKILRNNTNNHSLNLAVATRGAIMYDRVLMGRISAESEVIDPDQPHVVEGAGCEKVLSAWFIPPATNSVTAQ